MKILFLHVAERLSKGDQLLHWALFVDEISNIILKHPISNEFATSAKKYLVKNKSEELVAKCDEHASRKNRLSVSQKSSKDYDYENRYANELRYALIYAVFVTPILMQNYYMPHTRVPHQINLASPGRRLFDIQFREQLEKNANETTINNSFMHQRETKED